jgi:hypothetical protein
MCTLVRRQLGAIASVLMLGASSAPAEAGERCVNGRDLAADMRGRVYQGAKGWYGCLDARDRPVRISRRKPELVRVASPYAAVTVASRLLVIDLRRGTRRVTRMPAAASELVLGRQGSAVVVVGTRVQRVDRDGTVIVLDEGAVAAGSLALTRSGERVYWTKDGLPHTAALPPAPDVRAGVARRCAPPGRRQLAADARGRIYQSGPVEVSACIGAHGRRIAFDAGSDEYYAFTVASPFAAVVGLGYSPYGGGSYQLQIIDMRDGSTAQQHLQAGLQQLVLTNNGVAVFVQSGPPDIDGVPTGPPTVQRMNGTIAQLDEGNIGSGSLGLSADGRHVYWLKDAAVQTATL